MPLAIRLLSVLFGCFVPCVRPHGDSRDSNPDESEQLDRVSLAGVDQLAVCNDGSAAAYYFKDNNNTKLWVVYLGGGGWCYDYESCAERDRTHPELMSSSNFSAALGKTGIFAASSALSPLFTANKVFIPYCSSDAFMGDGKYLDWDFRGARIVRAVIEDLVSKGLGEGAMLIFGGGSSGGRGAMVLLDEVADSLPKVLVRGFLDSPFYIDIESYSSKFAGFPVQHYNVLNNFNAFSVVSAECNKKYPMTEAWKCLFGQYRMPLVKTPNLMIASQFDSWQLSHLVRGSSDLLEDPVFTKSERKYIEKFGRETHDQIVRLRNLTPQAGVQYSFACYSHAASENSGFWAVTTSAGFSEADAVKQLLLERVGLQRWTTAAATHDYYVDDCSGYNCGKGCASRKGKGYGSSQAARRSLRSQSLPGVDVQPVVWVFL